MNQENRTDPMIAVFPRVTKCTFHKFGPSGSIQKHDALCILALNILNEKIFIFLWFWLLILSALSGLALLYSSMLIVLPGVRETVLKRRFRFGTPAGVSSLIRKTQVSSFLINPNYFNRIFLIKLIFTFSGGRFSLPPPSRPKHGFAHLRRDFRRAKPAASHRK